MAGWLRSVRGATSEQDPLISVSIPFSMTGDIEPKKMILNRHTFTDKSTIGTVYLLGIQQCYSLERTARKNQSGPVCIPCGKYEIIMQWSARFQMDTPHLLNVPFRTFIEIHPGNKPEDSEGCILLGQTKDTDWVGSSRAAYNELIPKLEEQLKADKLYIEITGS